MKSCSSILQKLRRYFNETIIFTFNFADAGTFWHRKRIFGKDTTFSQSNSMRAVLEII